MKDGNSSPDWTYKKNQLNRNKLNYPWKHIIFFGAWCWAHWTLAVGSPTLLNWCRCRYILLFNQLQQLLYIIQILHTWLCYGSSGEAVFRNPLLPTTIKAQYFITPAHAIPFRLPPILSFCFIYFHHMIFIQWIKGKQPIPQFSKWKCIYFWVITFCFSSEKYL